MQDGLVRGGIIRPVGTGDTIKHLQGETAGLEMPSVENTSAAPEYVVCKFVGQNIGFIVGKAQTADIRRRAQTKPDDSPLKHAHARRRS